MSIQVGLLPPQSLSEALADLSRHPAVGGWKSLACHIRPELAEDPDEAGKWMRRALDINARDIWHDTHMDRAIQKGREVGCHVVWHWKCHYLGYKESGPSSEKSRELTLREERARIAARDCQIQAELEKLNQLRAVK